MDKKDQLKDTGKLTNFHYGTEKDNRTPEENGKFKEQSPSSNNTI